MNRLLLPLVGIVALSGCVVHHVGPPAPPPPAPVPAQAFYYGEHALPGGGWCYVDGPHEHDFFPQRPEHYGIEHGYYVWRGPIGVTYYAGHPLPGGGWCPITGPHVHEYIPPRDEYWVFRAGHGYIYRGPYSAVRPPPAHYWARPVPVPMRRVPPEAARRPAASAVSPAYAPPHQQGQVRPAPAPAPASSTPQGAVVAPGAVPRPAPPAAAAIERPAPGASVAAPGHGNVPPGQGGTPPGQAVKPAKPAPAKAAKPAQPAEREHRKHDEAKPRRVEP